jgi:hypothetical protein
MTSLCCGFQAVSNSVDEFASAGHYRDMTAHALKHATKTIATGIKPEGNNLRM